MPADAIIPRDWNGHCVALLQNASNLTEGLVDMFGRHVAKLDDTAWGVDISTCYKYCSSIRFPVFSFPRFAGTFTNFLLPWLALTAQLPYEARDPYKNVISFCMAVGSPALITYSLVLTILNRYWIRNQFQELSERARDRGVNTKYTAFEERVAAAKYLLQEAQQVPLRASQNNGWLSSLIVAPGNEEWWQNLKNRLVHGRRGVTASLVFQLLAAILAWVFTVSAAFKSSLGDGTQALDISSGSTWIWLIPVICGWVMVGTQYFYGAVHHDLSVDAAHRAIVNTGNGNTIQETQQGIFARPSNAWPRDPQWLGMSVQGDEAIEGPAYNYARVFTWWQFATIVRDGFDTTITNIADGVTCHGGRWDLLLREENLTGDMDQTATYCGLHPGNPVPPYIANIAPDIWKRILIASLFAVLVQWGTTGPAILIAYLTPTQGLGCRSGSYVLYGVFGTLAWATLVISALISHAAMVREQDEDRGWRYNILCALAVLTRMIGKIIVVVNAMWLILSSLFQYIGMFENCWCQGCELSLGSKGWIMLFKTSADLAESASGQWGGGIAMSIIVCVGSFLFFYLACKENNDS